jgi:hypothetical protein
MNTNAVTALLITRGSNPLPSASKGIGKQCRCLSLSLSRLIKNVWLKLVATAPGEQCMPYMVNSEHHPTVGDTICRCSASRKTLFTSAFRRRRQRIQIQSQDLHPHCSPLVPQAARRCQTLPRHSVEHAKLLEYFTSLPTTCLATYLHRRMSKKGG